MADTFRSVRPNGRYSIEFPCILSSKRPWDIRRDSAGRRQAGAGRHHCAGMYGSAGEGNAGLVHRDVEEADLAPGGRAPVGPRGTLLPADAAAPQAHDLVVTQTGEEPDHGQGPDHGGWIEPPLATITVAVLGPHASAWG